MNVGILCYASVGGSGVVASELGKCLALRGHGVHVISSEPPFRLQEFHPGVRFHSVHTPGYPLFREPQYLLALANRVVQVGREHRLDILHAHYAIPHSAAAYLARQILASTGGAVVPKVVTTLHGTDISILGSDPSYRDIVAFCIDSSDGVTAVSESLKADTLRDLPVHSDIRVVPNFLDCHFRGRASQISGLRESYCTSGQRQKIVLHISNFRPVKRVEAVIRIFHRIRSRVPAKLLLVGEGPDSDKAMRTATELGVQHDVEMLGEHNDVTPLLSIADLFLLPSERESFGLAALEAMACEVPVVASRVGGLPEVIDHGVTGFLHAPDDIEAMAESAIALLEDDDLQKRMAAEAKRTAFARFSSEIIVPRYEQYYLELLGQA
jgi:L-malate glycosyltransferase